MLLLISRLFYSGIKVEEQKRCNSKTHVEVNKILLSDSLLFKIMVVLIEVTDMSCWQTLNKLWSNFSI